MYNKHLKGIKKRMIKDIGYSTLGWQEHEIINELKRLDGAIVDVRISPFGRVNLKNLKKELPNYFWVKVFGNPWRDDSYTSMRFIEHLRKVVDENTINLLKKIDEQHGNIYLMCACKDFHKCHRKDVLKFLREKGMNTTQWETTITEENGTLRDYPNNAGEVSS